MDLISQLMLQIFFVLIPFVLYNIYYRDSIRNYSRKFILITCALSLFLSMTFPSSIESGIIFDVRQVIIYFGIFFGGFQVGLILFVEFIIYRLFIGGQGAWVAVAIMLVAFPLFFLLSRIHKKTKRYFILITLLVGIILSVIPTFMLFFFFKEFMLKHLTYTILILPILNSIGTWLLISLFNKSISDKAIYKAFINLEKVHTMSQVAASIAHEVRNPLTTVLGFLKLIKKNSLSKEKIDQYIDISIDELLRTEKIISDYLSISKPLTSLQEQIVLNDLLQNTVEIMIPYASMNNVELEIEKTDLSIIIANPEEMKQMLVNFLKNAIEACTDASMGRVFIHLTKQKDQIELTISDNGIGMTEEQIEKLGTIYFSTKSSGTGLGLTYSYQVIRSLNGSVSVRSELNCGTVFTIKLPIGS